MIRLNTIDKPRIESMIHGDAETENRFFWSEMFTEDTLNRIAQAFEIEVSVGLNAILADYAKALRNGWKF